MTNTLLRITTVSITALSLSACMSGSNSPWTPEFGQAQGPHPQQSTYGQSQYNYAQYPMPNAQSYNQDEVAQNFMASMGLDGSQFLSPLPNTYPPQPMAQNGMQTHATTPTSPTPQSRWTGQQSYNSQYGASQSSQGYQASTPKHNTQSYQPGTSTSYQSPYNSRMSAPAQSTSTQAPHMSHQSRTYGQTKPAAMTPPTSMTPQRQTYGQATRAPMMSQSSSYRQTMQSPMQPQHSAYGQRMSAPMGHARSPMMQQQAPQSNMIPWGQAMAWMYQGQVKSVMQSHKGNITMVLHNGQTAETQSPQIDDVLRLKQDCGAVCQNMTVATE